MSRLERKVVMTEARPIRVYAQFPAPLRLCVRRSRLRENSSWVQQEKTVPNSAVQRRKHLAEAKCTEEACLRRGHSPKVNPKGAQACARRGEFESYVGCLVKDGFHPNGEGYPSQCPLHKFQFH